ncbi:hypothetical protein [Limosilactobacillus reuteri]|uniref:Uncharacterized protein n=1 Tax=Limosilactobacillus reuteri TaxID=1598 RepID=A0A1V4FIT8_LIMRT|nr:hypothetical protein [Limosilactobacillus reuteri]MDY2688796.1 hypothetical protein [Limosilactobacillus reuteri]MDY5593763.1 hypothetical protein [Limosilactobacillus reuteri]OPG87070.1 hypothetical protein B5D07_10925 [Limosilactobacillus reuteri]
MSSFATSYRRKQRVIGDNRVNRNYNRQLEGFNLYYKDTLTKHDCIIDGVPTQAVFQDHSQSNNKDLSDDKYVVVPNSVEVGVGSYIEWADETWMVFTEEYKTIPSHQQLKIKHTNRRLKWLTNKNSKLICNFGKGWPAYVQNQTLYTLGVSFSGQNIALANAKMSVYIKDVPETRAVKVGTRLWIAGQVYKIEFADYVSRPGLVNWLLDEDTKNPETDNSDLEIADYWDSGGKDEDDSIKDVSKLTMPTDGSDSRSEDEKPKVEWNIEGTIKARLGHTYVYTAMNSDGTKADVSEWMIGNLEDSPFYVKEKDNHSITVIVKDIYKLVGQTVTITAKANDEIKNIAIKIIKKF